MIRHPAALALLVAPALIAPAAAQTAATTQGVQAIIEGQIDAFQADDFEQAFTYASPNIKRIFRTPENFGRMVTQGYPMVHRPRSWQFIGLEDGPQGLRQVVLFTDQEGRGHVADYHMLQVDGDWRINGVTIRPAPGAGA